MSYLAAIVIKDRALCSAVLEFEKGSHASRLIHVLKASWGVEAKLIARPDALHASAFNLADAASWLDRETVVHGPTFIERYQMAAMIAGESSSSRPPNMRVEPPASHVTDFEEPPPVIDYFWQDHGLDRRDWEAYIMAAESPRTDPHLPDTRWFHEGLDRDDWERYLKADARREALLEEGWDAEDIAIPSDRPFDDSEYDAYREMQDDILWDATFSANNGYGNSVAMGMYTETSSADLDVSYARVAHENGIDDWEVRGPIGWSYDPRGDD